MNQLANGARAFGGLKNVRRYWKLGGGLAWLSFYRSKGQRGQGLIEFGLVFAFTGAMVGLIWLLITSRAAELGFNPVWWVIHLMFSGWADWMWAGQMP
jgi:hypothetical protein